MKINNTRKRAFKIAEKAHFGQKDKAGNDYIYHPIKVASMVDTDEEKAVAYLHDVIEDTFVTLDDLIDEGFSESIIKAIDAITKRDNESYDDYLRRVSTNKMARKVKIADMIHNSDLTRYPHSNEEDVARCNKYKNKINQLVAK